MRKVIKIIKQYKGGATTGYIFVNDGDSDTDILHAVENWCEEEEGVGSDYRYRYVWSIETDPIIIKKVYMDRLREVENEIGWLTEEKSIIESEMKGYA